MTNSAKLLDVALNAARAGAEQVRAWQGRFQAREKSPRDLVTDADLASEEAIRRTISSVFPEHGFLGEESAAADALAQPYCWIVDPLDGTTNYAHGYPFFAVSIAVAENGDLKAGVVLDPERDECFAAAAGRGATLNGRPIQVSRAVDLQQSVLAISLPPTLRDDSPDLRSFLRLAARCQAVRRTGSAALNLAYVACGRLDGHWAHEIHPWDGAAGVLLVNEAGGVATACDGNRYDLAKSDYLAASSPELHQTLQSVLAE